jgi:hypothetical protein
MNSSNCYILWMCVCSLSYPARNAHAPYIIICGLSGLTFSHIISQTARLSGWKKRLLNLKFVLISCTNFVRNICHSKKSSAIYYHKCTMVVTWSARYYLTNSTTFGGKKVYWTYNLFWFLVRILSEIFLILRRVQRYIIVNAHWSSRKVPDILFRY